MLAYFSIEEIAEKSGLSRDQILRFGMSGTIIFSVLEHAPRNYEEVAEFGTEDGGKGVRTRTNETMVIVGGDGPALKLKYIGPNDVINVVTNEAPNRKTLVRALYETRALDPKKGKWLLNNPWRVSIGDLVISKEEWEYFSKGPGKQIKYYLPLARPEIVTLPWLFKNLSVGGWLATGGIVISIFGSGVYIARTQLYQELVDSFRPAEVQTATPNQALKATPDANKWGPHDIEVIRGRNIAPQDFLFAEFNSGLKPLIIGLSRDASQFLGC